MNWPQLCSGVEGPSKGIADPFDVGEIVEFTADPYDIEAAGRPLIAAALLQIELCGAVKLALFGSRDCFEGAAKLVFFAVTNFNEH